LRKHGSANESQPAKSQSPRAPDHEILTEVFHLRPSDVENIIQKGLKEKSWNQESWPSEEELWTERCCLGK